MHVMHVTYQGSGFKVRVQCRVQLIAEVTGKRPEWCHLIEEGKLSQLVNDYAGFCERKKKNCYHGLREKR